MPIAGALHLTLFFWDRMRFIFQNVSDLFHYLDMCLVAYHLTWYEWVRPTGTTLVKTVRGMGLAG